MSDAGPEAGLLLQMYGVIAASTDVVVFHGRLRRRGFDARNYPVATAAAGQRRQRRPTAEQ